MCRLAHGVTSAAPRDAQSSAAAPVYRWYGVCVIPKPVTTSRVRVLIVDDDAAVLSLLADFFTERGDTVETAESGLDALEAIRRQRPDAVLLDIRMPGPSGVEVLRRIREIDPALAVIMITANDDEALARETLRMGALDYIAKPFDFTYLERAMAVALLGAGRIAEPPGGPGGAAR